MPLALGRGMHSCLKALVATLALLSAAPALAQQRGLARPTAYTTYRIVLDEPSPQAAPRENFDLRPHVIPSATLMALGALGGLVSAFWAGMLAEAAAWSTLCSPAFHCSNRVDYSAPIAVGVGSGLALGTGLVWLLAALGAHRSLPVTVAASNEGASLLVFGQL